MMELEDSSVTELFNGYDTSHPIEFGWIVYGLDEHETIRNDYDYVYKYDYDWSYNFGDVT